MDAPAAASGPCGPSGASGLPGAMPRASPRASPRATHRGRSDRRGRASRHPGGASAVGRSGLAVVLDGAPPAAGDAEAHHRASTHSVTEKGLDGSCSAHSTHSLRHYTRDHWRGTRGRRPPRLAAWRLGCSRAESRGRVAAVLRAPRRRRSTPCERRAGTGSAERRLGWGAARQRSKHAETPTDPHSVRGARRAAAAW